MPKEMFQPQTDLGKVAFELDRSLQYFNSLASELSRTPIDSEKGLEKALECFNQITEARTQLQSAMVALSATLNMTRDENEKAEQMIAELLPKIQARKSMEDKMFERFHFLGQAVSAVNNSVAEFKVQTAGQLSEEDRQTIQKQIPEVSTQLGTLVEEAARLVSEAREANLKTLEKNADSMRKSLASARNRLDLLCASAIPSSGAVH